MRYCTFLFLSLQRPFAGAVNVLVFHGRFCLCVCCEWGWGGVGSSLGLLLGVWEWEGFALGTNLLGIWLAAPDGCFEQYLFLLHSPKLHFFIFILIFVLSSLGTFEKQCFTEMSPHGK